MLQREHSAILSTFIKLPFVIKTLMFCLFLSGYFTQVLLLLLYCRPAVGSEKQSVQDRAEADVSAKLGLLSGKLSWVVEYPSNFNPKQGQVMCILFTSFSSPNEAMAIDKYVRSMFTFVILDCHLYI